MTSWATNGIKNTVSAFAGRQSCRLESNLGLCRKSVVLSHGAETNLLIYSRSRAPQSGRKGRCTSMKSKSIHEPSCEPSRPEPINQTGPLTDEQRAFANVVGQALADAWRRKWQNVTDSAPPHSPESARSSTQKR